MDRFKLENGTAHNSGLALTIFLKFCRMKGANRFELISCFSEKNLVFLASKEFCTVWIGMVKIEPGRC